jgi:hypothetical protein
MYADKDLNQKTVWQGAYPRKSAFISGQFAFGLKISAWF